MRRATLLLPLLLAGCFTTGVWDWADRPDRNLAARPEEVIGWRFVQGGELELHLRWSDETRTHLLLDEHQHGTPAHLVARARNDVRFDPAGAARGVRLAVRRGWPERGFTLDPALAPIRDEPLLLEAEAAPVVSPSFVVRRSKDADARDGSCAVWIVGDDGVEAEVGWVGAQYERDEGDAAGRTVLAVLATPFTLCLDLATAPIQVVVAIVVIVAVASAFGPD